MGRPRQDASARARGRSGRAAADGDAPTATQRRLLTAAQGLLAAGHLPEAAARCRRVLRADPGCHPALHLMGVVQRRLGRPDQAVHYLERAVAIAPERAAYHADLADARRMLDDMERAVAAYEAALAIDPGLLPALNGLGIARTRLGQAEAAAECFREALRISPNQPKLLNNLWNALLAAGDIDGAAAAHRRALAAAPGYAPAHKNLAAALLAQGRLEQAVSACRQAIALQPDYAGAHYALGSALALLGEEDDAAEAFRAALALEPGNQSAEHMLRAVSGATPETAPAAYVRELFDGQAAGFEAHVQERLGYRVPQHLRAAVDAVAGRPLAGLRILDLGCGTGLCGAAFRDAAARLVGVDLSPNMVRLAEARGLYDEVVLADVAEALREAGERFDLLLAGDTFIYVGGLDEVFRLGWARLDPGGRFAFSVESCPGEAFVLRPSGRFAHSEAYLGRLAAAYGFAVALRREVDVRVERGTPIPGAVYVLQAG